MAKATKKRDSTELAERLLPYNSQELDIQTPRCPLVET